MASDHPLAGTLIAITRPAGTGGAWAHRVRALGGTPLLLPGSSLRAVPDTATACEMLRIALASDIAIFTSPAAVRFARRLAKLRGRALIVAPGAGTLRALRHAGVMNVATPAREDSEGMLALPSLRDVQGKRVGIIGAAGGRGLLDRELAARGAAVSHAHVYQRMPARFDRRHIGALERQPRKPLYVLLSSAEALANIVAGLPDDARRTLLRGTAVASSERIADAAHGAGFAHVLHARSAHAADMLEAMVSLKSGTMGGRGDVRPSKPRRAGVR